MGPNGDTVALRFTVPEKPYVDVTVITVEPEFPAWTVREDGEGDRKKSGGGEATVNIVARVSEPLVAVTDTAYEPLADGVQERLEVPAPG